MHIDSDSVVHGKKYYDRTFPDYEMIPVLGEIKAHHFRYKEGFSNPDTWDDDRNTMTEWHISQQNIFPKEFQEVPVKNHRADVLFQDENGKVAIEFQHSHLSAKDIRERTLFYSEECGCIVWVFDYNDDDIIKEGNYFYSLSTTKFISAFTPQTLPPSCEIFLHRSGTYYHVTAIMDGCKRIHAYELDVTAFKGYIKAINMPTSSIPKEWKERKIFLEEMKDFSNHVDGAIQNYVIHIKVTANQRMIKDSDAIEYQNAIEQMNQYCYCVKKNIEDFINNSYDDLSLSLAIQALEIVLSKLKFDKDYSEQIAAAIHCLAAKKSSTLMHHDEG